jgi:hypothetical protein
MMLKLTYLINDNRRQYLNIGAYYPRGVGRVLSKLEQYSWNLRTDYIYIFHTETPPVGYEPAHITF